MATDKLFQPELLTDKSRLQEIYDLRVAAYEDSQYKEIVNHKLFPSGWTDEVDDHSYHWILTNDNNKICAAARLTYFDSIEQLKNFGLDLTKFNINCSKPFGFFSRLVIDNFFRGKGISKMFDNARLLKLKEDNIETALVEVRQERIKTLHNFNFKIIGEIEFQSKPNAQSEILTLMFWKK